MLYAVTAGQLLFMKGDDMAYFANGSEGMILDNQCVDCLHANSNAACPINFVHITYNYDQCSDGQEKLRDCLSKLVNDSGICQMRKLLAEMIPNYDNWVEKIGGE